MGGGDEGGGCLIGLTGAYGRAQRCQPIAAHSFRAAKPFADIALCHHLLSSTFSRHARAQGMSPWIIAFGAVQLLLSQAPDFHSLW